MDASHKEMVAESKPEMDVKTMACQEMEARPEEKKPTSVDTKPEVAQKEEVPVQDATVVPVGESKKRKRRGDRKLVAERRCQKPKDTTREKCGSRRDWPSPAEGRHVVRKWYEKHE
jgi:hypothetical protein